MDNSNKNKPKTHFKTNVLLKSIIGKDLINNDNIAVLELIKNSFDAGSPVATVTFKNLKSNDDKRSKSYSSSSSTIVLEDLGRGMSEADVRDKWLNIAYSEKKHKIEEAGRILAGAKGIGRFSCDRLGRFLNIFSKKAGSPIVHLHIDWKAFEFEEGRKDTKDIQIEDIEVFVESITADQLAEFGYKISKTGTIIEISKLRAEWDDEKLQKLRHYLERLLNPNQAFDKKKFSIFFKAPEFGPSLNGEIKNQIFEKLDFTTTVIESFISADGKEITTNLRDKGQDVFTIIEKNSHKLLRDIKIVVYFLNTYSKIYFAKQTGLRVRAYGSIFLFKNGFRISPYGDEGNDWLSLEFRKSQGQRRFLGTRDIVGRIEIDDPLGQFKEVSSREGLVQDRAFLQLTDQKNGFFFNTLRRLERYVVDGLAWDRVPESVLSKIVSKDFQNSLSADSEEYLLTKDERNKSILASINSILRVNRKDVVDLDVNSELIGSLISAEHQKASKVIRDFEKYGESKLNSRTFKVLLNVKESLLKKEKKEAEARARQAEQARKKEESKRKLTEEELKHQVSQNLFYRSRINIDVKELMLYHHDIGIAAGTIENYLSVISSKIKKGKGISDGDLEKYIKSISLEVNKINAMVNFATKANFNDASRPRTTDLVEFISEYLQNVIKQVIKTIKHKDLEIEIVTQPPPAFVREFVPLEIMIVVDNLVKNATKAGAGKLMVGFETLASGELMLRLRDDGHGIPNRILNKVFDFGFTTTDGSGLGLYHVNEIVRKMKGEIEINNALTKGIEIKVTIPT